MTGRNKLPLRQLIPSKSHRQGIASNSKPAGNSKMQQCIGWGWDRKMCVARSRKPQDRAGSGPPVSFPLRFRDARFEDATSTAACRLDCSDVDLSHLHHRIERALGGSGIGISDRFRQSQRRNLLGQAPFVLAPAARTLFAAVADYCVPVTTICWAEPSSFCDAAGCPAACKSNPECSIVTEPSGCRSIMLRNSIRR